MEWDFSCHWLDLLRGVVFVILPLSYIELPEEKVSIFYTFEQTRLVDLKL